jgi:RNA polymerase sigma factor (sigma-70 family)
VAFESAAKLVRACRRGDPGAWDELLERHGRLIWAIALRAGLATDEAEEVFQRTWVAVVDGIHRLRDPDRLTSWVASTTRHQVYRLFSEASRHRRSESLDKQLDEGHQPAVPAEAEEALERTQREASVRDALAALDSRCRELLTLLFVHDPPLDYAEVSRRTGLAIGSIGPLRARCLARLRARFEEMYQSADDGDH